MKFEEIKNKDEMMKFCRKHDCRSCYLKDDCFASLPENIVSYDKVYESLKIYYRKIKLEKLLK